MTATTNKAQRTSTETANAKDKLAASHPAAQAAATNSPDVLTRAAALLDADQPQQALDLLNRAKLQGDAVLNAQAVCQLRLGKHEQAMELLRGRVIASSSVCLRGDVPTPLAVNFATALLLLGNVPGCQSALHEIEDKSHAGVVQLKAAVQQWRGGLSFWEKVRLWFGDTPSKPIHLEFPPGVLT